MMVNLKTFHPFNPEDKTYSEDFANWVNEDFIEPLIKLGFEFKGTVSTDTGEQTGAHIFQFEHKGEQEPNNEQLLFLIGEDEGSNWGYVMFFGSLTFIINWSA